MSKDKKKPVFTLDDTDTTIEFATELLDTGKVPEVPVHDENEKMIRS